MATDSGVAIGLVNIAENLTRFVARYAGARDWRLTEQWISLSYSRAWWQLVYAATPTYRFQREGGVEPMPIEAEACDAAIQKMITAGVLV